MAAAYGLYTHIRSNRRRSIALLAGLFFLVYLMVYAGALAAEAMSQDASIQWLLRAAWYAQELLTTFETELGEVALVPGTGGIFEVHVDATRIWSRAEQGGFPDIKELKQLVRDQVAPERNLGHTDRERRPNEP